MQKRRRNTGVCLSAGWENALASRDAIGGVFRVSVGVFQDAKNGVLTGRLAGATIDFAFASVCSLMGWEEEGVWGFCKNFFGWAGDFWAELRKIC